MAIKFFTPKPQKKMPSIPVVNEVQLEAYDRTHDLCVKQFKYGLLKLKLEHSLAISTLGLANMNGELIKSSVQTLGEAIALKNELEMHEKDPVCKKFIEVYRAVRENRARYLRKSASCKVRREEEVVAPLVLPATTQKYVVSHYGITSKYAHPPKSPKLLPEGLDTKEPDVLELPQIATKQPDAEIQPGAYHRALRYKGARVFGEEGSHGLMPPSLRLDEGKCWSTDLDENERIWGIDDSSEDRHFP